MSDYTALGFTMLGYNPHEGQEKLGAFLDERTELSTVLWPRRGGKTEGISGWLLGLCEDVPGTNVIMSGQTGSKARERFMGITRRLIRFYPEDMGGPKIRTAIGSEALQFPNGSRFWIAPPDADAFRGDAADVVWIDEAQSENITKKGEDLRQSIPPLFDTVEHGMLILSGTAPKSRGGWFWDSMELAREDKPGHAIDEYRLQDHEDPEDESLWMTMHPGLLYGLTTIEKMRARRASMSLSAWRMEYCSQTPLDFTNKALDTTTWKELTSPFLPKPEHFAVAYDLAPDNSSAAVTALWRNEDGKACMEVLREDTGTDWVAPFLLKLWKEFRMPIGFDKVVGNYAPSTELSNLKPPVPTFGLPMSTTASAEATIDSMIRKKQLVHFDQAPLNNAVEGASWRDLGDSGRLWGRRSSDHEIAPLVAGAVALHVYDTRPRATKPRIIRANNT